jgi:soluble lytic murein transglycosylase
VVEREALAASSRANGLDPALVAGLIRQESSFNPQATSPAGARGLMQLMPDVARSLARSRGIPNLNTERLYDPALNIQLGTAHLAELFRAKRETVQALAAYNAGESRVARWLKKMGSGDPELFTERIPFVETRNYVRTVVRNRAFYKTLYAW